MVGETEAAREREMAGEWVSWTHEETVKKRDKKTYKKTYKWTLDRETLAEEIRRGTAGVGETDS